MNITFMPNGTARCLYGELIDLHQIGRLHIIRASQVEFHEAKQQWRVLVDGCVVHEDSSRQECLNWEREHLGG